MTEINQPNYMCGFALNETSMNFISWSNYLSNPISNPPGMMLWKGRTDKYSSIIDMMQSPASLGSYNDFFLGNTQNTTWYNRPTCKYTEDSTSFCYVERSDQQVFAVIHSFNADTFIDYALFNLSRGMQQVIPFRCSHNYARLLLPKEKIFINLDDSAKSLLVCGYDKTTLDFTAGQLILNDAIGYSVVNGSRIIAFTSTSLIEVNLTYSGNPVVLSSISPVTLLTIPIANGTLREVRSGYFYTNTNMSLFYTVLHPNSSETVFFYHRPTNRSLSIYQWTDTRLQTYYGSPFIQITNFGSLAVVFQNIIQNTMAYFHFKAQFPGLGSGSLCPNPTCLICKGENNECMHCVYPAQILSGRGCIDKPPPTPPTPPQPAPCVTDPGKLECLVYLPPFNYTFTYYQPNIREPIIFLRLLFKDGDKYLNEALQLDNNLQSNFRVEFSLCAGSGQSFNFLNSFKLDDRRLQMQLNLTDSCKENLKAFYLADDSTKTETIRLVQVNNKTQYFNIGTGNPDIKISSTETRYLLGEKMPIASVGPISTETITDQSSLFGFLTIIIIFVNLVNSTCFGVNFVSMAFKSSLTLKIIYQLRLIDVYKGNTLTFFEKNFFRSFQDKPGLSSLTFYFMDYRYKLFMEKFNTFAFGMCFYRILACLGIVALIIFIRRRYTYLFKYYMSDFGPQYFLTTTTYFRDGGNSIIQAENLKKFLTPNPHHKLSVLERLRRMEQGKQVKNDFSYLDSLVPKKQHVTNTFRMMLRLYLFKFTYSLEFIALAILFQGVWIYVSNDIIHWKYGPGNKLSFSSVFCLTFSLSMVLYLGYQMASLFRLNSKTVLTAVKQKQKSLIQMIGSLAFEPSLEFAMHGIDQNENNEIELEFKNGRLVREVDYSFYYPRFREFEYSKFFLNGISDNIPINSTFSVHFNSIYFCYFIIFQVSILGLQMLPAFQIVVIGFTTLILIVFLIRAHFIHKMLKYCLTFYKFFIFFFAILCHLTLLLMYSLVRSESDVRFEYYKPPIYKGMITPSLGEKLEFGVIILILLSVCTV